MKYVLLAVVAFLGGYIAAGSNWLPFTKDAIVAAYDEGRASVVLEVVQGEIVELAQK